MSLNKVYVYFQVEATRLCRACDQSVSAQASNNLRATQSAQSSARSDAWLGAESALGHSCQEACLEGDNSVFECLHKDSVKSMQIISTRGSGGGCFGAEG
jgi:hypothetical protein